MAISRYRGINVTNDTYETVDFPNIDVKTIPTFTIRLSSTDRLDTLAFRYLGAGEYWWILAMINDISWGFELVPGEILKIPLDVNDVLKYF